MDIFKADASLLGAAQAAAWPADGADDMFH
jgi:hypothetical protein